jgi:hypothetical protein
MTRTQAPEMEVRHAILPDLDPFTDRLGKLLIWDRTRQLEDANQKIIATRRSDGEDEFQRAFARKFRRSRQHSINHSFRLGNDLADARFPDGYLNRRHGGCEADRHEACFSDEHGRERALVRGR